MKTYNQRPSFAKLIRLYYRSKNQCLTQKISKVHSSTCVAHGTPDPEIQWFKQNDRHKLERVTDIRDLLKVFTNGTIKLNKFQNDIVSSSMDLSLGYWCQVRNKITNKTFLSQTAGRIKLTEPHGGSPPTVTDNMETVTVGKGESIELNCATQGNPPPSYQWKSESNKILSRSSLLVLDNMSNYEPLKAYIRPNIQVVDTGKEIKLQCEVQGNPKGKIKWFLNGKPMAGDSRVMMPTSDEIHISSATREDEGMYQCFVQNKWETIETTAQVILGDMLPSFISTFSSRKLQPGPSISLRCIAVGRPSPSISWEMNGEKVKANTKFLVSEKIMKNGTIVGKLIIKNIRTEDGGDYSCRADNKKQSKSFTNVINVYGLPIVHNIRNVTVAVGGDVYIRCYVSGYPIKEIRWERGERNKFLSRSSSFTDNGTLIIKNSERDDQGSYICKAESNQGISSQQTMYLRVIGDDPLTMTWKKNGKSLKIGKGTDVTSTKLYSLLQMRKVSVNDRGNYSCIVENEAGKAIKSVELRVNTAPIWKNEPEDMETTKGKDVMLNCNAIGNPKPKIEWLNIDGKMISALLYSKRKYLHENGSLSIKNTVKKDEGTYRCVVSNGVFPNLVKEMDFKVHDNEDTKWKADYKTIATAPTLTEKHTTFNLKNKNSETRTKEYKNKSYKEKDSKKKVKDDYKFISDDSNVDIKVKLSDKKTRREGQPTRSRESDDFLFNLNFNSTIMLILPTAVVIILLIAVIITLSIFLITRKSNRKRSREELQRRPNSDLTYPRKMEGDGDFGSQTGTINSRYGQLRHSGKPIGVRDSFMGDAYEIPNYYETIRWQFIDIFRSSYGYQLEYLDKSFHLHRHIRHCSFLEEHTHYLYHQIGKANAQCRELKSSSQHPLFHCRFRLLESVSCSSLKSINLWKHIMCAYIMKNKKVLEEVINIGIDCAAHGNPDPLIKWLTLEESQRLRRPVHKNGTLQLKSFSPEQYQRNIHASVYICVASNIHGAITSPPIPIRASTEQQQQHIQAQVYDTYVISGNTAVLTCHIPTFFKDDLKVVSWIREDNLVIKSSKSHENMKISQDGKLYLTEASASMDLDLGYWCQIKNTLTGKTFLSQSAGRIKLTEPHGGSPPTITDNIEHIFIKKEESIELNCAAQSNPPPSYMWMSETCKRKLQETGNVLKVFDTNQEDEGMYQCIVSNKWGSIQTTAQVVLGDMSPTFKSTFSSRKMQPGPSLLLKCSATWKANSKHEFGKLMAEECTTNSKYVIREDKTKMELLLAVLLVKSITSVDGGEYSCAASNKVNSTSFSANINVYGIPVVQDIDNVTAATGSKVEIKCYVSGYPIRTHRMEKSQTTDGGLLIIDNIRKTDQGLYQCSASNNQGVTSINRMHVRVLGEQGTYSCIVSNEAGSSNETVQLRVNGDSLRFSNSVKFWSLAHGLYVLIVRAGQQIVSNLKFSDKKAIELSKSDKYNIYKNGSITIRRITKKDAGKYRCVASNGVEPNLVEEISLLVEETYSSMTKPVQTDQEKHKLETYFKNSGKELEEADEYPQVSDDSSISTKEKTKDKIAKPREEFSTGKDQDTFFFNFNSPFMLIFPTAVPDERNQNDDLLSQRRFENEDNFSVPGDTFDRRYGRLQGNDLELSCMSSGMSFGKQITHIMGSNGVMVSNLIQPFNIPEETTPYLYRCNEKVNVRFKAAKLPWIANKTILKVTKFQKFTTIIQLTTNEFVKTWFLWEADDLIQIIHTMSLIVFHFGKTSITGPVFITVPKRKVEFINTVGVKLDCAAHGNPDPKITWLRRNHNQELEEINTIPSLLRLLNNGTIELLKFTPNQYRPDIHATVYLCTATNTHGKIVSSQISVRGTTEQQQQLLQAQVYDEYVIKGNTAVFTCHIPAFFKDDLEVIAWIREDNFSIKKLKPAGRIKLTEPHGGSPPTITDSIELVSMQRGETIELSCAAQANPPPSYIWKSKSESQVLSKSSILKLTLTEYGTSVYVCTVRNKFGSEKGETTVVVREPLRPFIHPNYQVLNSGSELKLSCNVKGHPVAKITWFFNGKILKDNDKVTYQKENVLKIFAVDRANEGMYQCFAENKWETAQTTAQVVLGDMPPILIRTFTSKKIQPGPSIILKCTAVGRPVPKFTWKVNGKDVRGDNDKFVIREENMKNGTVTGSIIVKSIRAQDGGEYTCLASNNINVTSHSGDVIVYGLPVVHLTENVTVAVGKDTKKLMKGFYACSADNGPGVTSTGRIYLQVLVSPKWIEKPNDKTIAAGRNVKLECKVKGDPSPRIKWVKIKNDLILSQQSKQYMVSPGNTAKLTCTAEAVGIVRFKWYHKGSEMAESERFNIMTKKLSKSLISMMEIRNISKMDVGKYTCEASNQHQKKKLITHLYLLHDMNTEVEDIKSDTNFKEPKFRNEAVPTTQIPIVLFITDIMKTEESVKKQTEKKREKDDTQVSDGTRQDAKFSEEFELPRQKPSRPKHKVNGLSYYFNSTFILVIPTVVVVILLIAVMGTSLIQHCNSQDETIPYQLQTNRESQCSLRMCQHHEERIFKMCIYILPLFYFKLMISEAIVSSSITGPVFLKQPRSQVDFLNNEGATIDCSAYGIPDPKINWYRVEDGFDRKLIEDIPSLIQIYRNGTLVLLSFPIEQYRQEIHASIYVCSASNSNGSIISPPVSVRATTEQQQQQFQAQVYDEYVISGNTAVLVCHIPAFHKEYMDVIAWIREDNKVIRPTDANSKSQLDCAAQGYPPPDYKWLSDASGQIVSNSSVLVIDQTEKAGTFFYSCQVTNKFGKDSKKFKIIIRGPLEAFIHPNQQTVNSGNEFELECRINGHPIDKIKWTLNGDPVSKFQTIRNVSSSKIKIKAARREHEGMYQCFVSNNWDKIQTAAQVILGDVPPKLVEKFQSRKLQPGPSISLKCTATGRPTPKITWKLRGRVLMKPNDAMPESSSWDKLGTLSIKKISVEDEGTYSCSATNGQSQKSSAESFIKVLVKPEIQLFAPPLALPEGKSVLMTCNVISGSDPLKITWKVNNSTIDLGTGIEITSTKLYSLLQIRRIQWKHRGNYSCIAENDAGTTIQAVLLKVKGGLSKKIENSTRYLTFDNGTLQISEVSSEDEGKYQCIASNGVKPDIKRKIELIIEGSINAQKYFYSSNRSKNSFKIGCLSKSQQLDFGTIHFRKTSRIIVSTRRLPKYIKSVISIEKVSVNDLGEYKCEASTQFQTKQSSTYVTILENLFNMDNALMFILPAVVVVILLLAIVITLAIYLLTKKNNHDDENGKYYSSFILPSSHNNRIIEHTIFVERSKRCKYDENNIRTTHVDVYVRSNEDNYGRNMAKDDFSTPRSTIDRRYGQDRFPGNGTLQRDSGTYNYEIPNYCVGIQPYSTLQFPRRNNSLPLQTNRESQCSVKPFLLSHRTVYYSIREHIDTVFKDKLSQPKQLVSSSITGPVFLKQPRSQVDFLNNEGATIDCSAYGIPDPKINWYRVEDGFDRKLIEDIPSLIQTFRNGTLVLHSFPIEQYRQDIHASIYVCCASNSHGSIISPPVSVRATTEQQQQQFQAQVYDEYVISGNTAVLVCHIPAFHKEYMEVIAWIREDNKVIRPTDAIRNKLTRKTYLSQTAGRIKLSEPQGGVQPSVTDTLNTLTVKKDSKTQLDCAAQGYPPPGLQMDIRCKWTDYQNKSSRREHEGMYQCFVSNNWERIQTAAQVILGDVPPILVEKFQTKKLQPGPSISLKCTATGRPTPKITWKLRGRILSSNNKFIIIEDEVQNGRIRSKVVVKNIRSEDGGEYTCEASNENKIDIHSEIINIYGLPKVQKMKDAQVIAGEDAIIKCYVSGYPIREIKWVKVRPNDIMPESSSWDKQGILSIKKISVEDEGTYSCSATNGQSEQSSEDIFIKVLGESVLMTCNVISGSDPLTITWKVDNSKIDIGKGVEVTSTKLYSLLQIRRIEWKHRGNYSCIAENDAGTTIQAVVLKVKVAPKWKPVPSNVFTAVDKDIVLKCNAIGEPKPKIKWIRITVNDLGEYKCEASTQFQMKQSSTYVTILENLFNMDNALMFILPAVVVVILLLAIVITLAIYLLTKKNNYDDENGKKIREEFYLRACSTVKFTTSLTLRYCPYFQAIVHIDAQYKPGRCLRNIISTTMFVCVLILNLIGLTLSIPEITGPVFLKQLKTQIDYLNTEGAKIDCSSHGNPDPEINWYKMEENQEKILVKNIPSLLKISGNATTSKQQEQLQAQVYDEYVINGNAAVLKCHIPAFYKEYLEVIAWIREDNKVINTRKPSL
ncbi:Down syndrome cell adhesion molecule-like protein Dscam2 [Nymphon striatum]|nr:Down syndrome cell adhesion molecule-like protein Dscam2 [Nymphon striatum]